MAFDLSKLSAPVADKKPVRVTHHGIEKTDNYDWLRAENWQEVMRDSIGIAAGYSRLPGR